MTGWATPWRGRGNAPDHHGDSGGGPCGATRPGVDVLAEKFRCHLLYRQFPAPPTAAELTLLQRVTDDLAQRELVQRNGTCVELTQLGMLLAELVHQEYEQTFPSPSSSPNKDRVRGRPTLGVWSGMSGRSLG